MQDFLDYLVFVAHDAETLQFYLWLRQYRQKFDQLVPADQELSPVWGVDGVVPPQSSWSGTVVGADEKLGTPSGSVNRRGPPRSPRAPTSDDVSASLLYEIQPLRQEVEQAVRTYLAAGAPRELNISSHERMRVLEALQHTTHPSAFRCIEEMVESLLRHQSYPNFVRYAICNGNKPRIVAIQILSFIFIVLATLGIVAMVLSSISRWYRIALLPLMLFGVVGIITAARGLCLILTVQRSQNAKQYQFDDSWSMNSEESSKRKSVAPTLASVEEGKAPGSVQFHDQLFDPFGPKNELVACSIEEFGCGGQSWESKTTKAKFTALQGAFANTGRPVQNEMVQKLRMCIIARSHLEAFIVVAAVGAIFVVLPVVAVW